MDQEAVLDFLSSHAWTNGKPVKRIDTHAASVFLSGTRALKVKRAIKFSFLDYSTLALRKKACLDEIEVNRNFAPELYLGIARITEQADGELAIGGDGPVVEWAVEMRRFDDALTLDHYSDLHEISADMAEIIARQLAEVHRSAKPQPAETWIKALERYLAEHRAAFMAHPEMFASAEIEQLFKNSQAMLGRGATLIRQRQAKGLLVRGHGDLHLGNIALINAKPVIFDAVEFDPIIASGDVLYDLAFLLMDLIVRGSRNAANIALNGYIRASGREENLDALALLPLFLSIRSSIRAVVTLARYDQRHAPADAASAKRYFSAAVGFLSPPAPRLIAIGGLSGTGKSYLARLLAPEIPPSPGAVVLRSDSKRKMLLGVSEQTRLPPEAYTREMSERVYRSLFADARRVLAAGHSVILDAVFGEAGERLAAKNLAAEAKVDLSGFFLEADLETRLRRVGGRTNDASDANRAVVLDQEKRHRVEMDWTRIGSAGQAQTTLQAILNHLG